MSISLDVCLGLLMSTMRREKQSAIMINKESPMIGIHRQRQETTLEESMNIRGNKNKPQPQFLKGTCWSEESKCHIRNQG